MHNLGTTNPIAVADATSEYDNIHALIYFIIYYVGPYWAARGAVKANKPVLIANLYKYFLHLFISTHKSRYARLTIRYLWVIQHLHPEVQECIDQHRVFNFHGKLASGIAYDMFVEKVYYFFATKKFSNVYLY